MKYTILKMMLIALVLTIFLEVGLAFICGIRKKKDFLNIVLVNILTNPLVVSISFYFNITRGLFMRNIILVILEILTIIIEGYLYSKYLEYKKINPFLFSFLLNIFSFLSGEIINYILY